MGYKWNFLNLGPLQLAAASIGSSFVLKQILMKKVNISVHMNHMNFNFFFIYKYTHMQFKQFTYKMEIKYIRTGAYENNPQTL